MVNPWDVKLGSLDARKRVGCRSTQTPGGVFSWKKEDFDQKRWHYCEKEG